MAGSGRLYTGQYEFFGGPIEEDGVTLTDDPDPQDTFIEIIRVPADGGESEWLQSNGVTWDPTPYQFPAPYTETAESGVLGHGILIEVQTSWLHHNISWRLVYDGAHYEGDEYYVTVRDEDDLAAELSGGSENLGGTITAPSGGPPSC